MDSASASRARHEARQLRERRRALLASDEEFLEFRGRATGSEERPPPLPSKEQREIQNILSKTADSAQEQIKIKAASVF